jgi:hypothetical protein
MSLAKSFLMGLAKGGLKENNRRASMMEQRMQELATNNATIARERAQSKYESDYKSAMAEHSKINSLRSEGLIDTEGTYTKKYRDDKSYVEFQNPEVRKAYGGDYDKFKLSFDEVGPRGISSSYKTPDEITRNVSKTYESIAARQRVESSQPVLTSMDKLLMGSKENQAAPRAVPEIEQYSSMAPQAPQATREPQEYTSPEFSGQTEYTPFQNAFDVETGEAVGNVFVAKAPDGTKANVQLQTDGSYAGVNVTSVKPVAAEIKLNVPKENRAAFEKAYATGADTISATSKINQSLGVYLEKSQGSQGFIVDVVSGIAALTTIWQGSGNANEEKIKVQKAYDVIREATDISTEEKVFLLNPDNKNVIIGRGKTADVNEREKLISRMQLVLDEEALEEGQEYLTVAVRNSTLDTLAISAAWDMARANRQGDGSKISLREVESYIDLLGASSNEQDFITKINVLKEDLVKKSLNSLHNMFRNTKFGGTESTFSTANGTVSHLLDPKSGDVALIQKGTIRKEGRSINMMYIMTGREGSIIEINLDDGTSDDLIKLDQWDKIESNFSSPVHRSGRAK